MRLRRESSNRGTDVTQEVGSRASSVAERGAGKGGPTAGKCAVRHRQVRESGVVAIYSLSGLAINLEKYGAW